MKYALLVGLALCASAFAAPLKEFTPGEIWPDDQGAHINAHGGGILLHQGTYYWFGEHKIAGDAGNYAHVGVGVYSSKDLYNWKNGGIALAVSTDPQSEIAQGCILERPKVIYNAATGKFVMWFHLEFKGRGYKTARSGVAVADKPEGPYTYLHSVRPNAGQWPMIVSSRSEAPREAKPDDFTDSREPDKFFLRDLPGGQMARDMTLFVDDDGRAYHIYASEENATLQISLLAPDYLKPAGRYIRIFPGASNEAPAILKKNGKYYLIAWVAPAGIPTLPAWPWLIRSPVPGRRCPIRCVAPRNKRTRPSTPRAPTSCPRPVARESSSSWLTAGARKTPSTVVMSGSPSSGRRASPSSSGWIAGIFPFSTENKPKIQIRRARLACCSGKTALLPVAFDTCVASLLVRATATSRACLHRHPAEVTHPLFGDIGEWTRSC